MLKRALAVVGIGVAGSQAGHLLSYQIRFGAMADGIQSSGAHAYFPLVAKTAVGLAGLALIAALLLIGVSRMVGLKLDERHTGGPPYMTLLAGLFTIQLAIFMTQESVESAIAGVRLDATVDFLLWGMVGQLPVAIVGAAALRWIWTRVELAAESLIAVIRMPAIALVAAPVMTAGVRHNDQALLRSHAARSRAGKRGPPTSSF